MAEDAESDIAIRFVDENDYREISATAGVSQGGSDNSQSHSANVFRVDDPRSEARVLHELTQNKMAEDAESDIAIRFVDENDYREISATAVPAQRKLKKNRPSSLV
ncbi:unnamed protein product [Porites evermanni]|uniref:Uncharacterized protein n=1 Tax=Porites evermanni TaxID=104178 RepID=A0ABN8MPR6_9CNID|nr:unnamed protein product [Porites evermanni]